MTDKRAALESILEKVGKLFAMLALTIARKLRMPQR
jgi:hypothetical protein